MCVIVVEELVAGVVRTPGTWERKSHSVVVRAVVRNVSGRISWWGQGEIEVTMVTDRQEKTAAYCNISGITG